MIILKELIREGFFFFFDRVKVMELYSVRKLNQAISGEGYLLLHM